MLGGYSQDPLLCFIILARSPQAAIHYNYWGFGSHSYLCTVAVYTLSNAHSM